MGTLHVVVSAVTLKKNREAGESCKAKPESFASFHSNSVYSGRARNDNTQATSHCGIRLVVGAGEFLHAAAFHMRGKSLTTLPAAVRFFSTPAVCCRVRNAVLFRSTDAVNGVDFRR